MQTRYVFPLLALVVLEVSAAGVRIHEPIVFMGLQGQLNTVGTSTRAKFSAFQTSMDHRKRSLQRQLEFDIEIEENDYKKTDKDIVNKAKKQGQVTDPQETDTCVSYGQAKHGVDLRVTHNKYMACIDNATEVAKKVLDDAKKNFTTSFDASANANVNEKSWRACLSPPDGKCVERERTKYSTKIENAKKLSGQLITEISATNKTLYDTTNECVGDLQTEISKLQKSHYDVTKKCITEPGDTAKKILECFSGLQKM